jgi:hypothetical protein
MNKQSSTGTTIDIEVRRRRKDASRWIFYIVFAFFLLVTLSYTLLLSVFKIPFKKLVLSYAIIIVLLIVIVFVRGDIRDGSIMSYIIR